MTVETWGSRTGTGQRRGTPSLRKIFIVVLVAAAIAAIAFAMLNRSAADLTVPRAVPAVDTLPALIRHHEEANGVPLGFQASAATESNADALGAALARHHEEANTPGQ